MAGKAGYAGTPEQRFWRKVNIAGPVSASRPDLGPCWLWTAGTAGQGGYPMFWDGERRVYAYRWSYEQEHGSTAEGLEFDHLCRTHRCVRPSHVEPVPHRTNLLRGESPAAHAARQTACQNGHPYTRETTWLYRGERRCRVCHRTRVLASQKRHPDSVAERSRRYRIRKLAANQ